MLAYLQELCLQDAAMGFLLGWPYDPPLEMLLFYVI